MSLCRGSSGAPDQSRSLYLEVFTMHSRGRHGRTLPDIQSSEVLHSTILRDSGAPGHGQGAQKPCSKEQLNSAFPEYI